MEEQRLDHACRLVDEGKYSEAYIEFIRLADDTPDPIERAWPLLFASNTLQTLGQEEAATSQLSAARALLQNHRPSGSNEKFQAAETFLDFVDATLFWRRTGSTEEALRRLDEVLQKHRLALRDPRSSDLQDSLNLRRAFILADLGRWQEALPILEAVTSSQEFGEGVAFYLGHCYLAAHDDIRAEQKLTEALRLGQLPSSLECRAHLELGMTYYNLRDYAKAKAEFEKGVLAADPRFLKHWQIWKWLERTCLALGLETEAEHYARAANPS